MGTDCPLIPLAKPGGNKHKRDMREVVHALMYVLSPGCQWRAIPKDLPPRSTVYDCFDLWDYDGTPKRTHHVLYVACREQADREARPTAAIIDSYQPPKMLTHVRRVTPHERRRAFALATGQKI